MPPNVIVIVIVIVIVMVTIGNVWLPLVTIGNVWLPLVLAPPALQHCIWLYLAGADVAPLRIIKAAAALYISTLAEIRAAAANPAPYSLLPTPLDPARQTRIEQTKGPRGKARALLVFVHD